MWFFIIGLIDTILKGFQYGWFFIVPIILFIIILMYKRRNSKKYPLIIKLLIGFIILILLTSRMWGPNFYKYIIGFQIGNKEILIEEKLEQKYNKNFTFISKEKIKLDNKNAGDTLGQDVNDDYSITYRFKDDDGVIAIVKYKKNCGYDYYESKRSKYDLEKSIYDYANKIGFDEEFYVFVTSPYYFIRPSDINGLPNSTEIYYRVISLILPKRINGTEELMINALKNLSEIGDFAYIHEYIVTEDEYKKVINYYESEKVKNGIEGIDYEGEFKFDKNEIINLKYYYFLK